MNDTEAARPSARYESGRLSARARKAVLAALVVAVLIAGGAVAYAYYSTLGATDLQGQAIRYETIDDSTMGADISLSRDDPSRPAMCVVRARNKEGTEVARREVYFPPTGFDSTVVSTTMHTSLPGGVVDVYGCTYNVPAYLQEASTP